KNGMWSVVEIDPESTAAVVGWFLFQRQFGQVQAERIVLDVERAFGAGFACCGSIEVVSVVHVDKARQFRPPEKVEKFVAALCRLTATLLSQPWYSEICRQQNSRSDAMSEYPRITALHVRISFEVFNCG